MRSFKMLPILLISVIYCSLTLSSQERINWNELIQGSIELMQGDSTISQNTKGTDSWTIHSAFWNNEIDNDNDDFVRSKDLNVSWTTTYNPDFSIYSKILYKDFEQSQFLLYTQSPTINGYCYQSSCTFNLTGGVIGPDEPMPHSLYDFRMEIYDANTNELLASLTPGGDPDFNDEKFELNSEDVSSLSVSVNEVFLNSQSGSNAEIDVYSTMNWSVSDNASWLEVSPTHGSNNGTILITATEENLNIDDRSAIVTISGYGIANQIINVTQGGSLPFLNLSADTLVIAAEIGSSDEFSIMSNASWSINDNASWLSVDPITGSGNGSINVSATNANTSLDPRNAFVFISAEGVDDTSIYVVQEGASPYLTVETNAIILTHESGSLELFNLNSNVEWQIECSDGWLEVNPMSGNNSQEISVIALTENTSAENRYSTITVSAAGVANQIISVTQQGFSPALSLNTNAISLENSVGSTTSFEIFSNISWSITSEIDWISISQYEGNSNEIIAVTALSINDDDQARSGTVSISGEGVSTKHLTIIQEGATNIDEHLSDNYVMVYQNHQLKEIIIETDQNHINSGKIIISDMTGKALYTKEHLNNISLISYTRFKAGGYVLSFVDDKNKYVKNMKLVIF